MGFTLWNAKYTHLLSQVETMNKAMHAESSHVVVVLEQALEALTLTATIPQDLQSAARTLADMCVIGPEAAQAIQDHVSLAKGTNKPTHSHDSNPLTNMIDLQLETETALAAALQRKVEASQRPEVVVDEDDDIETLQTDLTKRLHHMLRCVVVMEFATAVSSAVTCADRHARVDL